MYTFAEHQKALELAHHSSFLLKKAYGLIKGSLNLVQGTANVAKAVVILSQRNQIDKAKREFDALRGHIKSLQYAATGIKEALEVMRITQDHLSALGMYSEHVVNKDSPFKNIGSVMSLNIQRCEATKEHLENLLKNFKDIQTFSPRGISLANSLSHELENIEKWYAASSNSLRFLSAALGEIARLAEAAITQQMSFR